MTNVLQINSKGKGHLIRVYEINRRYLYRSKLLVEIPIKYLH